jgi:Flp pilus assembly protein TadD
MNLAVKTKLVWVVVVGLLPLIFMLYGKGLHGTFQYDDRSVIVENPALRTWNVDVATLRSWWGGDATTIGKGHYRPVTLTTYAMNYRYGGLDPFGYHVVNIVVHWAVAAVLVVMVWTLLRMPVPALLAGVVFSVTPYNSEAVSYIAARSSLLASFFYVLSIVGFIWFRDLQRSKRLWESVGCAGLTIMALILGLVSKEIVITAPVLWLCYDLGWSRDRPLRAVISPYLWGLGCLVVYIGWTGNDAPMWAAIHGDGVRDFWSNLWTQIGLLNRYLALFVWPYGFNVYHEVTVLVSPWSGAVLMGALVGGGLMGTGFVWLVGSDLEKRTAGFMVIWFLVTLSPTMLYPLNAQFQEHRGYLPGIGLSAGAAIWAWRGLRTVGTTTARRAVAWLGFVLVLGFLGMVTSTRAMVWSDPVALWSAAVATAPNSLIPRLNLGGAFLHRDQLDLAEREFSRVLDISPDHPRAYFNLGLVALRRGRYDDADVLLRKSISLDPQYSKAYQALGQAAFQRGSPATAVWAFQQVVTLNPHDAKAYAQLGFLAHQAGRDAEAEAWYRRALQYDPGNVEALNNVGVLYMKQEEWAKALDQFSAALARAPDYVEAAYNRATALDALGRAPEARLVLRSLLPRLHADQRFDQYRRAAQAFLDGGETGGSPATLERKALTDE